MSLKIFAFSGVYREKSLTSYCLSRLISDINNLSITETTSFFKPTTSFNIKFIQTADIFSTGKDSISDSMDSLRNEMLSSDIILLGTPVYLRQVSGCMKSFLDRIGNWTHTLDLRGKLCINVTINSANGGEDTSRYLDYIVQQMGMSLDSSILISTGSMDMTVINNIIDVSAQKLMRHIYHKAFNISNLQEEKYRVYKSMYQVSNPKNRDELLWSTTKLPNFSSYKKLFTDDLSLGLRNYH